MSTTDAPSRSHVAQALSDEAYAALPKQRSFAVCFLVPFFVGLGIFVVSFLVWAEPRTGADHAGQAHKMVIGLAPWVVALPWLKHLDLRRVPWFFACLLFSPLAGSALGAIATYRALSLPYRHWAAGWWNVDRARTIPPKRMWVLIPAAEAGPDTRSNAVRRLDLVERWGWGVLIAASIPMWIWEHDIEDRPSLNWMAATWAICAVILVLAPNIFHFVARRRKHQTLYETVDRAPRV